MLTVIADKAVDYHGTCTVIFKQPITTKPWLTRTALVVKVKDLPVIINWLQREKITIEHIFDY